MITKISIKHVKYIGAVTSILSFFRSYFHSSTRAAELKFAVYELILICECVKKRGHVLQLGLFMSGR